ncbi:hypothetical protein L873DRAFT_1845086 [Choiromyces venosus 120613-1]|uniref:Uncharacterized protein n=1 Tax=Choiromyces venosus 120613-1 TaxID=1336337 RepID=A0A3N4JFD0_9PEZI|nr:hypothetical protein L873DRAFT_1845086 [Choiromyces venosus 120613-1]
MSKRSYGEDHPDLSGDTLTDKDIPSHAPSSYYRLSSNLTPPTGDVHSDGGAGVVPTIRCGGRDVTGEEGKLSDSSAGIKPAGLSGYGTPAVLGSGVNCRTSNSLKNSCHQACIIGSCIAGEDRLIDGVEWQRIHKAFPPHNTSTFVPPVSVPHTREVMERRQKDKGVFAWIDAVITSSGHTSDSIPTTSPIPIVATRATTTGSSARPGGNLLLIGSDNDDPDSTGIGGPNPSYPCLIKSPPSLSLVLSGALTTTVHPYLREAFEYPSIQKGVERMPTVLKVVISAPKEAKPERKDARSPILGPIFSGKTALYSKVRHTV